MARKRKLLVRDWFFYVVWYIRLKRLLNNYYATSSESVMVNFIGSLDGMRSKEDIKEEIKKKIMDHYKDRKEDVSEENQITKYSIKS